MIFRGSEPSWQKLVKLLRGLVTEMNNMELTNCLWALAVLSAGISEPALVSDLIAMSSKHLCSFEPRNLALSAWALAKMGTESQAWCHRWAEAVKEKLATFETRDMTNATRRC